MFYLYIWVLTAKKKQNKNKLKTNKQKEKKKRLKKRQKNKQKNPQKTMQYIGCKNAIRVICNFENVHLCTLIRYTYTVECGKLCPVLYCRKFSLRLLTFVCNLTTMNFQFHRKYLWPIIFYSLIQDGSDIISGFTTSPL